MKNLFASFRAARFSQPETSVRLPTSCPYCPGSVGCHWTKAATYPRYGLNAERIRVQRYECQIKHRTFSLLPDALLPHQQRTTATILACLADGVLADHGPTATARTFSVPLITVRRIRLKFQKAVNLLRLPGHAGALSPIDFLKHLAGLGVDAVADLFMAWKELEPKHSLMGIHRR